MKSETPAPPAPLRIALTWQIPATLNAKLIAEAEREKRVRRAQITDALGKFFEPPDENAVREQSK